MYGLTAEEFFMYLTMALVVVIPVSVRIYRRMMIGRLKEQLRDKGQTS
jgi:hypothetical protein